MPDSQITKHALAQAMKDLMAEKPMTKISIGDIAERCSMNRQSFYYHFKDKYDLVNWIYYTEFISEIKTHNFETGWEFIEKVCEFFEENKVFYCNALKVTCQNSFYEYFSDVIQPIILIYFKDIFEESPNQNFYAEFLADALRASITRWLLGGAKIPTKEFVSLIKDAATGVALKVVSDMQQ